MPTIIGYNPKIKKQVTCDHCGAINEYTPNEVRTLYTGRDVSGMTEVTKGFNCAGCHYEIVTDSY